MLYFSIEYVILPGMSVVKNAGSDLTAEFNPGFAPCLLCDFEKKLLNSLCPHFPITDPDKANNNNGD